MEKQPYIIKYSNYLKFNNKTLAFRKKCLFDITSTPKFIPFTYRGIDATHCGWWIDGVWLSRFKAKELTVNDEIEVDVSNLQWNKQIELDECFNLEQL